MSEKFTLGVNYWPRRKAMYWWSDFDANEVREEFSVIKEIGLDVVRFFLLWEDFQPEPDSVSQTALDNLVTVCDIAAENGLGVDLTFFTGTPALALVSLAGHVAPLMAPKPVLIDARPRLEARHAPEHLGRP